MDTVARLSGDEFAVEQVVTSAGRRFTAFTYRCRPFVTTPA